MKYGKVELGQIEAAINKLGGEKGLHDLLSGKLKVVQSDQTGKQSVRQKQPKLLIPDGHYAAVELKECHDPDAFYQSHEGLYVWDDFRTGIVAVAKTTEAGKKFKKVSRFKLDIDATGEELKSARPNSVWTATDFCAWLAAKLAQQPNGEEDELLTGWANLFLVEGIKGVVFVVHVRWDSGHREWGVSPWRLDRRWLAGRSFASR